MYASGSRFSRRATIALNSFSISFESSIEPVITASRVTPAASAIRTSASSRDDSIPTAARLCTAISISARAAEMSDSLGTGLCAERLLAIVRCQRVDHRIDRAVEKIVELMNRHVDAMVGHARLRKIVGADALRAVARPDHRFARLRDFRLLLRLRLLQQPRPQDLQRLRLVLVLRFFVALNYHHPAGNVSDSHRRVSGVDALPARSRRAHHIDPQVL